MLEKFTQAFDLLARHLLLLGAIALTTLPSQIYMVLSVTEEEMANGFPPELFVSLVAALGLTVLAMGALYYALNQIDLGKRPSWSEAMKFALVRFLPVLTAILVTSVAIVLGLVAFILQCIYLALRFALVMPIAVIENPGTIAAIKRSGELTEGIKLELLGAYVLFIVGMLLLPLVLGLAPALLGVQNPWVELAIGCIVSVVAVSMQIVLYLYYRDRRTPVTARVEQEALPESAGRGTAE